MRTLVLDGHEPTAVQVAAALRAANWPFVLRSVTTDEDSFHLSRNYAVFVLCAGVAPRTVLNTCARLRRSEPQTPIMVVSPMRGADITADILDAGADDVVAAPFDPRELAARLRALVRRAALNKGPIIQVGDLTIATGARTVRRAGREIRLTRREYTLLEALARHEGQALTRNYIQDVVWQDDRSVSNNVDACIYQLRRKVDAGFSTRLIHTVYGVGYRIARPSE